MSANAPDILAAAHERTARGVFPRSAPDADPAGAARRDLATWLTAGRVARGMTREQIAQVTRIQLRTIERLEDARFDELPADVFVRGFIRNYARCVGLSVDEALRKYGACGFAAAPVTAPIAQALALLDSMAPLAGHSSSVTMVPPRSPQVLRDEPNREIAVRAIDDGAIPSAITAETAKAQKAVVAAGRQTRAKRIRDAKGRFVRSVAAALHPSEISSETDAAERVAGPDEDEVDAGASARWETSATTAAGPTSIDASLESSATSTAEVDLDLRPGELVAACDDASPAVESGAPATDLVPSAAELPSPSRFVVPPSAVPVVLFVDDVDPDRAERDRELRAKQSDGGGWRSFLPPVLLDQGRNRQGGLTLAVIVLLIVATLTLSYLMRRPSSTGEGVTSIPATAATAIV